jgi:hypothetical protein
MSMVIVGMTISLDVFIRDENGSLSLLYSDLETLKETKV